MKIKLMIGLLVASVSGGAFAGTQTCADKSTGHQLVINFPAGGGMGTSHGTGRLTKSGVALATLGCTFTSGITTTLNCGTRQGYWLSAAANLKVLPLSYQDTKVATLVCK